MAAKLTYAAITPARDEAATLPRLAACVAAQTVLPVQWVIVENGSSDETRATARRLAENHAWIKPISVRAEPAAIRGAAIVESFHAGLAALDADADIVVNLDADVSFDASYFELLLDRFLENPRLGIASGSALEFRRGRWRQRHVTGSSVWGATRAYRSSCLDMLLPLEARFSWDGIDSLKANARGWVTQTYPELRFRHHRGEGERDADTRATAREAGQAAYYMGYRWSYLTLRALFAARRSPVMLGMIAGYAGAMVRRAEQLDDQQARTYLREQQRLAKLPKRVREALGRAP